MTCTNYTNSGEREALLWALLQVRDGIESNKSGICGEAQKWLKEYYMVNHLYAVDEATAARIQKAENAQRLLWSMNDRWPEASKGEHGYPIEGHSNLFRGEKAKNALWQNPRRIALLDWLIKELENDANQSKSNSESRS